MKNIWIVYTLAFFALVYVCADTYSDFKSAYETNEIMKLDRK